MSNIEKFETNASSTEETEKHTEIKQTFNALLSEQIQETTSRDLAPFKSNYATELFSAFKKSPEYPYVMYLGLDEKHKIASGEREARGFRSGLTGKIWLLLATNIINANEFSNRIALSRDKTLSLCKSLYPDRPEIPKPFDENGLAGISIPGSMLIDIQTEQPKITGIIHYTTTRFDSDIFESRFLAYSNHIKKESERNPDPGIYCPDAKIIFAVPGRRKGTKLPEIVKNDKVKIWQLPVGYKGLMEFVDDAELMINNVFQGMPEQTVFESKNQG
jgi:hypothetical protein